MKAFIAAFFAALTSIVEQVSKVFTKTIPEVGQTIYDSAAMANDFVHTARYESLIENHDAIEQLKAASNLTEDQLKAIDKRMEY